MAREKRETETWFYVEHCTGCDGDNNDSWRELKVFTDESKAKEYYAAILRNEYPLTDYPKEFWETINGLRLSKVEINVLEISPPYWVKHSVNWR